MTTAVLYDDHLLLALNTAIVEREKFEQRQGYTGPSALLQVWKDAYDVLANGGTIEYRVRR